MKNVIKVGVLSLSIFLLAFKGYRAKIINPIIELPVKGIDIIETEPLTHHIELKSNSHSEFLKAIGFKESGNRYDIVNSYGYMGKYQFGKSTLKTLKIKVTKETLIPRPETEELVQLIYENNRNKYNLDVLDIGTGSGCIVIALKLLLKNSNCFGLDISKKAITIAKENARNNNSRYFPRSQCY